MTVAFREARPADLPAIVAMLADDMLGQAREDTSQPLDPRYRAAFDAMAADPNHSLIVAEETGEVVATLQLTFLPGLSSRGAWRGLIEAVRVRSDRRGQGLGATLITHAVAQCRARQCIVVQLSTNAQRKDAHRFYERLGFVGSHRGYKLHL